MDVNTRPVLLLLPVHDAGQIARAKTIIDVDHASDIRVAEQFLAEEEHR